MNRFCNNINSKFDNKMLLGLMWVVYNLQNDIVYLLYKYLFCAYCSNLDRIDSVNNSLNENM